MQPKIEHLSLSEKEFIIRNTPETNKNILTGNLKSLQHTSANNHSGYSGGWMAKQEVAGSYPCREKQKKNNKLN